MKKEHFDSQIKSSVIVGVIVAILGCALGFFYLINKAPKRLSPSVFAEAERNLENLVEEGPFPVFVLPLLDRGGDSFAAKRQAFIEGDASSLELSEAELNAWLKTNFTPANDPNMKDRPFAILPSVPKVSLQEGYLQIVLDLSIILGGDEHKGVFTTKGVFEKTGVRWSFDSQESAIASARIPGGSIMATTFVDFLKSIFAAAPEYQEIQKMWARVNTIEVEPGLIRILR